MRSWTTEISYGMRQKLDDLVLEIGDRKTGARITVTRLPNRTGIQEVASRQLDA